MRAMAVQVRPGRGLLLGQSGLIYHCREMRSGSVADTNHRRIPPRWWARRTIKSRRMTEKRSPSPR